MDIGAGAGFAGEYLRRGFPAASYAFVEPIASLEASLVARFGAGANRSGSGSLAGAAVVTLLDVLEHQEDDLGFLRGVLERMDAGAVLVLTVPALKSLWSPWDEALGHFRRYDKRMLKSLFERLPVATLELSYLFPEMVPVGYLRKWRLGGRAKIAPEDAEFPDLAPWLNETLYALGLASLAFRSLHPCGTSLIAALRVKAP